MSRTERFTATDARILNAAQELEAMISERYPDASFTLYEGEDPDGVYLRTIVDLEDTTEVMDVIGDRLLDIQVEEGLPLYVVAVRPMARVLEQLRTPRRSVPAADLGPVLSP